ncbi:MAG: DNA gyrase subunit A [Negativicutes bacterium]|nr:DNA gyrase subunit A [Negativicutes bacterium]
MQTTNNGKVIPVPIERQMKSAYLDYAMSVIVARALPDVRDGLKPVHRRILYAMHEAGMASGKPYKKSARIVGEVLGKYHPHGDSSVYDATVRLAQDFSTRYPLIDGHGNFGSIDGDAPAAMRYTEVRMAKMAEEMLCDIDKNTVDFAPNYDESLQEPRVLPARIPNLLINGAAGIAVGMATNIPPHNLREIVDGLVYLIDHPDCQPRDLLAIVHGPDFPTGGIIMGREGIEKALLTGRGTVKIRARAHIEAQPGGRQKIIVSQIPYMINKSALIESIAECHRNKLVDGIGELRDESDRDGMRIVVELKRDAVPEVVLNRLFKHTRLEDSFGINMIALVRGRPRQLNLWEMMTHYLEHRQEIITRRTSHELARARERAHLLEGLVRALDHLDAVIATIRAAKTVDDARQQLMKKFGLSDKQAQAILDMRLQRLTALERDKIIDEYRDVLARIDHLAALLADPAKIMAVIRDDLLEIRQKYGDGRRTQISAQRGEMSAEDLIADEEVVISMTHLNYVKRQNLDVYKSQRRGGRGVVGMSTREEDFVERIFVCNNHHNILFFTSRGRVFRLKAYDIPEAGRTARGTAIVNLLALAGDEKGTAGIPVRDFIPGHFLFMATRMGTVKKTDLVEFDNIRRNGLNAISLGDNDDLISVRLTDGQARIMLATRYGQAVIFDENQVRPMGRSARGVRGITLYEDDQVVNMEVVHPDGTILTVTSNGYGKRSPVSGYRQTARGSKGVINHRLTEKTGEVVASRLVMPEDDLLLISDDGIIIRLPVAEISILGRSSQGVRLMKTGEHNCVAAVAVVTGDND